VFEATDAIREFALDVVDEFGVTQLSTSRFDGHASLRSFGLEPGLLQRVLAVAEDGVIGPATVAAAQRAEARQTIRALQRERLAFLKRLSTWPTFGRGWQARVAAVEREALALAAEATAPQAPRPTPRPTPVPIPPQKGLIMNDVKSILASRTVWANLVGLVSVGLTLAGIDTGDLDVNRVAESAAQLVAAASFIGSTVFRIAATRRLIG